MGQIETDKKLELVRSIRMNHLNNRALMGRREQIIYGTSRPLVAKGELYGLESAALSVPEEAAAGINNPLKSFKLRLLIAVVLFAVFIFWDRTGQSFWGFSTTVISEAITSESGDIFEFVTNLFHKDDADVKE